MTLAAIQTRSTPGRANCEACALLRRALPQRIPGLRRRRETSARSLRRDARSMERGAISVASALLIIVILAAAIALSWWQLRSRPTDSMDTSDPDIVAQGRAVYEQHCASCHGAKLEGQPDWRSRLPSGRLPAPPHDASGHTWHHPGAVLFGIVKNGAEAYAPPGYQSDMPAYGNVLTDPEIWAALAYLKSTWPVEIQRRHDAIEKSNPAR